MDIKQKLGQFSKDWTAFLNELSQKELADKEVMTLIVQYSQFIANELNAKVIKAAAELWPEQLKNFKKSNQPKSSNSQTPKIVTGS